MKQTQAKMLDASESRSGMAMIFVLVFFFFFSLLLLNVEITLNRVYTSKHKLAIEQELYPSLDVVQRLKLMDHDI